MDDASHLPRFVIIGAMKCATTTLHDQLARVPGVYMSNPKEPNFFSDDEAWARGLGWYRGLFSSAPDGSVCGESSTHYTKLPDYPGTVERLAGVIPHARFIYVMRDPIDRLVSQYIHEWSVRRISVPIDKAVRRHPELIDYSRYAFQMKPWLERFGHDAVLPVFFERLTSHPQAEFERICRFVGVNGAGQWDTGHDRRNVSAVRVRRQPIRDAVLSNPALTVVRRRLIPTSVRERIKRQWRMEHRPELSESVRRWCETRLDPDMAELGQLLGLEVRCEGFADSVRRPEKSPEWAQRGSEA
jgi:hypothetical protein